MIRSLFALVLCGGCAAIAQASHPTYSPPIVVQSVPAYGVVYPDPTELAAELKALREEIKALRASLVQGQVQPQPAVLKQESPLKANCAACHAGEAKKGGGHSFDFDALSDEARKSFAKEIIEGRMPKGKSLTDQLKSSLITSLFDPSPKKEEKQP